MHSDEIQSSLSTFYEGFDETFLVNINCFLQGSRDKDENVKIHIFRDLQIKDKYCIYITIPDLS